MEKAIHAVATVLAFSAFGLLAVASAFVLFA